MRHTMINPKNSGGNVERWLVDVEVMMKKSLAYSIDTSMLDHATCSRLDWVQKWPGQVIDISRISSSCSSYSRRSVFLPARHITPRENRTHAFF